MAFLRFFHSHISSISRSVLSWLSGSCLARGASVSFPWGFRASPFSPPEKSSSWLFCRFSPLRSMIDLPPLVRAFVPRYWLGLSIAPPFGLRSEERRVGIAVVSRGLQYGRAYQH